MMDVINSIFSYLQYRGINTDYTFLTEKRGRWNVLYAIRATISVFIMGADFENCHAREFMMDHLMPFFLSTNETMG